jgi:hypothetical protein
VLNRQDYMNLDGRTWIKALPITWELLSDVMDGAGR